MFQCVLWTAIIIFSAGRPCCVSMRTVDSHHYFFCWQTLLCFNAYCGQPSLFFLLADLVVFQCVLWTAMVFFLHPHVALVIFLYVLWYFLFFFSVSCVYASCGHLHYLFFSDSCVQSLYESGEVIFWFCSVLLVRPDCLMIDQVDGSGLRFCHIRKLTISCII